jgi:hypothetical protein
MRPRLCRRAAVQERQVDVVDHKIIDYLPFRKVQLLQVTLDTSDPTRPIFI